LKYDPLESFLLIIIPAADSSTATLLQLASILVPKPCQVFFL